MVDLKRVNIRLAMRIACTVVALSTAACASLIEPPDASIQGIGRVSLDSDVDVIMIHGMGYNDISWAAGASASLAATLGRSFDKTAFLAQSGIPSDDGKTILYVGTLPGSTHSHRVNTFSIVWSAVDSAWKQTLCYDVTQVVSGVCLTPSTQRRAAANSFLKSQILDGRLSDVVYYVARKDDVQRGVTQAFARGLAGASQRLSRQEAIVQMAARTNPVFLMSESLGSKIIFDSTSVLYDGATSEEERQMIRVGLGRIREAYMAANQVPILSPRTMDAYQTKPGPPNPQSLLEMRTPDGGADESLLRFARLVRVAQPSAPIKIVAFSDPNDILSWKLRPYFIQLCGRQEPFCNVVDLVDVTVSNDTNWFGLVENPATAHTNYWSTQAVQDVLREGNAARQR